MFTEILQNGLYATVFVPGVTTLPLYFLFIIPLVAYLLGSLNSAVLVSRLLYHEDVRTKGSGNAGLTNIFRTYGKHAALLTLLGDILKSVLAILLTALLCGFRYRAALSFSFPLYLAGLFCIIGHIKPIYYGFRGGKGVLTSATVLLLLAPVPFAALFLIFVLIVWATKYISLGSIVSAAALPLILQGYMQAFIYGGDSDGYFDGSIVLFGFLYALIIILCHRANIGRLWRHEENKFSFHRKPAAKAEPTDKGEQDGK